MDYEQMEEHFFSGGEAAKRGSPRVDVAERGRNQALQARAHTPPIRPAAPVMPEVKRRNPRLTPPTAGNGVTAAGRGWKPFCHVSNGDNGRGDCVSPFPGNVCDHCPWNRAARGSVEPPDENPNAHVHAEPDSDINPNADTDAYANVDAELDFDSKFDTDAYANAHTLLHLDSKPNADFKLYTLTDGDGDTIGYLVIDANAYKQHTRGHGYIIQEPAGVAQIHIDPIGQ